MFYGFLWIKQQGKKNQLRFPGKLTGLRLSWSVNVLRNTKEEIGFLGGRRSLLQESPV